MIIKDKYIDLNPELFSKIAFDTEVLNIKLLDKSVALKWEKNKAHQFTFEYIHSVINKMYSMPYFDDFINTFYEIRYSHIITKCLYTLLIDSEGDTDSHLKWRIKYFIENSIFRYYSILEITGRFLNAYFDLKLDVNKKNPQKEKPFSFLDVIKIIISKYNHKMLHSLFEIWGDSQNILDYRIEKTHKKNPNLIEESIPDFIRKIVDNKTIYETSIRQGVGIDRLMELDEKIFKNSKRIIELCGIFFDIGHEEIEYIEKKTENKKIITLDINSIKELNRILRSYTKRKIM